MRVTFVAGLDTGNFHVQTESKLFVRDPEMVATKALAEMSHDGGAIVAVPRGPPALAQSAWSAAAESANALADIPSGSGEMAIRRRAQDDLDTRTFAAAVDPINYDQNDEEDTRGHVSDPARDQARDDRSFSRSTAKLTPQLFAELTGPGAPFGSGRSAPAAAQTSSVTSWRPIPRRAILRICSALWLSRLHSSRTERRKNNRCSPAPGFWNSRRAMIRSMSDRFCIF